MAYATSNPPMLIAGGLGTMTGGKLWFYRSTDAATLIRVAGYFTNGFSLGMRAGDVLFAVDTDASPLSIQAFVVNAATATQTDVSDGLAITATDSD